MKDKDTLSMTQKELLIRLDERVESTDTRIQLLFEEIKEIKKCMISSAEHTMLMATVKTNDQRIDSLENWRSKLTGQIAVFSTLAGAAASFIFELIKGKVQ